MVDGAICLESLVGTFAYFSINSTASMTKRNAFDLPVDGLPITQLYTQAPDSV